MVQQNVWKSYKRNYKRELGRSWYGIAAWVCGDSCLHVETLSFFCFCFVCQHWATASLVCSHSNTYTHKSPPSHVLGMCCISLLADDTAACVHCCVCVCARQDNPLWEAKASPTRGPGNAYLIIITVNIVSARVYPSWTRWIKDML